MEAKHTPGPWSVGATTEDDEIEVLSDARPFVCMVLPGKLEGVSDANARLIAAAPELLDVCKWARQLTTDGSMLQCRIDAVIAKATGNDG